MEEALQAAAEASGGDLTIEQVTKLHNDQVREGGKRGRRCQLQWCACLGHVLWIMGDGMHQAGRVFTVVNFAFATDIEPLWDW